MTNAEIINALKQTLTEQAEYFKNTLNYTFGDWESAVNYSHDGFVALCEEMGKPIDEETGIPEELAQPLANWLKNIWEQV